ncbi:hypothetical protein D1872_259690 [compost metagenome]
MDGLRQLYQGLLESGFFKCALVYRPIYGGSRHQHQPVCFPPGDDADPGEAGNESVPDDLFHAQLDRRDRARLHLAAHDQRRTDQI